MARAAVGIDEELVEGVGPPSMPLGDVFGLVEPRVSRRARPVTTVAMPGVESRRRRPPRVEPGVEVDEVSVVILVTAQVLAPEAEACVARKCAGMVSEAGGIHRVPLVIGRVENRARKL